MQNLRENPILAVSGGWALACPRSPSGLYVGAVREKGRVLNFSLLTSFVAS
jgi:hypothetical protein